MRGYLVQTLVALLDSLTSGKEFIKLTLEPHLASERFDLLWEYAQGSRAVQVKSSVNEFAETDVRRWAREMEASGLADEYCLCLVGRPSSAVAKLDHVDKVMVEIRNLAPCVFRELAAHRLDGFLRMEGLTPGTSEDREMFADALTARLTEYSTKGAAISRADLVDLLRTWVREVPHGGQRIAVSRLFGGKNKGTDLLFGRERELRALDAAWRGAGKKNVVTIVAWGGAGKTSLVAHWAAEKLAQDDHSGINRYFDWSFYNQGTCCARDVSGTSRVASADEFIKDALEFFGDPALAGSNAGAWQKGKRLAQLIGEHCVLLILDGLELLQDPGTGELRDDGLRALLRGLAAHNDGLCLVTTREHLPELATWRQTTAPEWRLSSLSDKAGADLLTKLGVNGTDQEKRDLSARVEGHALTLTLLGGYLSLAHNGDIRRVDRVDFRKANEKEQGGHAFRVIAAYVPWFEENGWHAELTILRILGLFDRPAPPDCLAALCDPPIPGLTDALASLTEDDWNEAVTRLVRLNLVTEGRLERRCILGYSEDEARQVWAAGLQGFSIELVAPKPFEVCHRPSFIGNSVDAHPLVREFFGVRLQDDPASVSEAAHSRLFEHLCDSVPYWPEGLDGIRPLYQAIVHGCRAGRYEEARADVYRNRVCRGTFGHYMFYSTNVLGAVGADLEAVGCFFTRRWSQPADALSEENKAWVLSLAAYRLSVLGRLAEAREPMMAALGVNEAVANWAAAVVGECNLSELELTLGDVATAVCEAEKAVMYADRRDDHWNRLTARTDLARAYHYHGMPAQSREWFRAAENMLRENEPEHSTLYGLGGFFLQDFMLADVERAAGRVSAGMGCLQSIPPWGADWQWTHDVLPFEASSLLVEHRAKHALETVCSGSKNVLHTSLHRLSMGRAVLYRAVIESSVSRIPSSTVDDLDAAVSGLCEAGMFQWAPSTLLARAWLRSAQDHADLARADLDESWEIAKRGPMKLHMADIHLHRARLFHAVTPYPWKSPDADLQEARKLIVQCGYHRRDGELADAEEAAKDW